MNHRPGLIRSVLHQLSHLCPIDLGSQISAPPTLPSTLLPGVRPMVKPTYSRPMARGKRHQPKFSQTRTKNRFRFRNFGAQIEAISFDTVQRYGSAKGTTPGSRLSTPLDGECWFSISLAEWRELNCTATFAKFVSQIWSLCGSLPQLLFHRDEVIQLLVGFMEMGGEAAAPLSAMTAALIKDLGEEIVPFFGVLFKGFIKMLGSVNDAETMEVVLGSLFYFIKCLLSKVEAKVMLGHLVDSLLEKLRPQVQDFLAEFTTFILNKSYEVEYASLLIGKLGKKKDLLACILAGVAVKDDDRFCEVVNMIHEVELLGMILESMVDRSDAKTMCIKVANFFKSLKEEHTPFIQAFTKVAGNRRMVVEQDVLLESFSTINPSPLIQDAAIAVLKLSELQTVLKNRTILRNLLADPRGVNQLCAHCPSYIELVMGTLTAVDIVISQILPVDKSKGIFLLGKLLDTNAAAAVVAKIPICDIKECLTEQDPELTISALKLLDRLPLVTELDWVVHQVRRQGSYSSVHAWISVLYNGRRFLQCDDLFETFKPHISNTFVLDILVSRECSFEEEQIVKQLTTSDSRRRFLSLQLLSKSATFCNSPLFKACFALESIPWTFNCDREKGLQLQVIENILKTMGATASLEMEMVVRYLFGVLLNGFHPLRKELYITLSTLIDHQVKVSRAVLLELFATLQVYHPSQEQKVDSLMFEMNSFSPFLSFLANKPSASELIQPQIVSFIDSLFCNGPKVEMSAWFRGQVQSSLSDLLVAVGGIRSIKGDQSSFTIIKTFLLQFLAFGDSAIQRHALDSILSLGIVKVGLFADRLRRLLDDKEIREELVALAADRLDEEIWQQLCGLLNRILYGRMISRKGANSGRNSLSTRRKLIFNYIACWDSISLDNFVIFIGEQSCLSSEDGDGKLDKWIGFLNLLQTILSKIGKRISQKTVDTVMNWFKMLNAVVGDSEKHKKVRRLTLKRLCDLYMIVSSEVELSHWHPVAWHMIEERVASLEKEFVQESSALLTLLHWWVSERRFRSITLGLGKDMWPRLAAALGGKARDSVLGCILDIWMLFLKMVAEGDQEAKEVLSPLVSDLCRSLDSRISQPMPGYLLDRVILLLLELSKYIETEEQRFPLISSLIKLLPIKSKNEESKTKMLHLATILHVPALHSNVYTVACGLLGRLCERESRAALAGLFHRLSQDDPSLVLFAEILADLHAPSKERVGEYDYEKQSAAFSKIRNVSSSISKEQWVPILNSMIYFCNDEEDTAARTLAFSVVGLFVKRVKEEEWMDLLMSQLYPSLKLGLGNKSEPIRVDYVNLLNTLVEIFRTFEPFNELSPLLAGDNEDANVILNLLHLQQHRRARALKRLADFANNSTPLSRRVIDDLLVPIIRHFVMSDPTSRDPVPPLVVHDATMAMAALYGHLPVAIIITRLTRFAALIGKGTPCEKALLKLIPATCAYLNDADAEQIGRLINILFDLLMNKKSEVVRAPIAISIAELLKRVPLQLSASLPKIVMSLGKMLAHKHAEKREEARETLKSVVERLGSDHLPFIVKELKSYLSSGHLHHILAYSIHSLLSGLNYNLDKVCIYVIPIVVKDIFGERAKEKTTTEWTGKMMEIKAQKSHETLNLLMSNVSTGSILEALEAIKEAVVLTENSDWVEKACKAIEDGIMKRCVDGSIEPAEPAELIKRVDNSTEFLALVYSLVDPTSKFYANGGKHWSLHSSRFQLIGTRVLHHLQKRNSVPGNLLNQFIPHLTSIVFSGRSNVLMTAAIKSLASALGEPLPSLTDQLLQGLLIRLFEVILKTDAVRHVELVNSTFKLICTLVRERDDVQLEEAQLCALLGYIRSNLENESNAPIAYTLIKTILRRKVMVVEVYELMNVLCRTMLRSFHPSVRQQCRSVVLSFLLDYPMARQKLDGYLSFFPANLTYEGDSGRESIVLFLASFAEKIPSDLVQEMAETWLVALAARLCNERNEKVKSAVIMAVKSIVSRIDTRVMDRLGMLLGRWLSHSLETVKSTGWSLAPLVIRYATVPVTQLINNIIEFINCEEASREMISTLAAIVSASPTASACDRTVTLMSMDLSEESRQLCNQLVGEYFSKIGESRTGVKKHTLPMETLAEWPRKWLKELQSTRDAINAEQIVKNLLFVSRQLAANPLSKETYRFATLDDLASKVERIHLQLPTGSTSFFASSMLKFYAALIMSMEISDALAVPIISASLRTLETSDAPMAQQVLDLLASQLGDRFEGLKINILQTRTDRRRKRKAEETRLAVIDPRAYSKRRLQRNRKNRR